MTLYKFRIDVHKVLVGSYANELRTDGNEFIYKGFNREANGKIELNTHIPCGKTSIIYRGTNLEFDHIESVDAYGLGHTTSKHNELYLTIESDSRESAMQIFKQFLFDAVEFAKLKNNDTIQMFVLQMDHDWIGLGKLPKRTLSTVYLDTTEKDKLVADMKLFYSSEMEYRKYGIPYTRKYLLEGPSGVGKSSLIFALASSFNKNIAMLSSDCRLDGPTLMLVIKTLENDNILVIENIDTIFSKHNVAVETITPDSVLNILDGYGRKDHLVIFMTTSNINDLDKTLVRAGRVDYVAKFNYLSKDRVQEMFGNFFPQQQKKFNEFYDHFVNQKVTTAQWYNFFFENRNCANILERISQLTSLINLTSTTARSIYM